ncbi:MAG TPA: hypothetical protein VFE05_21710 [Longimicrobiaceae bacterium]|nr:hypothetical protein [Longimicrobiaceae bacterium]
MMRARERRVGEVVGAVARQALADRGMSRIALLDDGGPEAELAARLLARALGEDAVVRVRAGAADVESLLHLRGQSAEAESFVREARRMLARLVPDALPACPANKTALLLGGELPPEPLLPLGDLYASDVAALTGDWSASPEVAHIARECGGIEALDGALRRWVDARDPAGLDALPNDARTMVREAFARGRASRLWPRLAPKLDGRTLGTDLFE